MPNQSNKSIEHNRVLTDRLTSAIPNIVDAFDPEEIILYGSYARGDNSLYSDIDLIIIAETVMRFQDRSLKALNIINDKEGDIAINPLVYTSTEFKNMLESKESFLVSAMIESVLLWKKEAGCDISAQLESPQLHSDYKQYL